MRTLPDALLEDADTFERWARFFEAIGSDDDAARAALAVANARAAAANLRQMPPWNEVEEGFHADLVHAIASVLADGGPVNDDLDAAYVVVDVLVERGLVPPAQGYQTDRSTDG